MKVAPIGKPPFYFLLIYGQPWNAPLIRGPYRTRQSSSHAAFTYFGSGAYRVIGVSTDELAYSSYNCKESFVLENSSWPPAPAHSPRNDLLEALLTLGIDPCAVELMRTWPNETIAALTYSITDLLQRARTER